MSEMLANQYFMTGRYAQAGSLFAQLAQKDPDSSELRHKLILCYLQTNQTGRALATALQFLQALPESPRKDGGTPADPVGPDQQLPQGSAAPDDVTALNRLGLMHLCRDLSAAVDLFERSLATRADQPQVREILTHLTRLEEQCPGQGEPHPPA